MDRRNFLRSLVGGVATAAAVRSWPFRVFSFPKEIRVVAAVAAGTIHSTSELMLRQNDLIEIQEAIFRAELPGLMRSADCLYRVLKTERSVIHVEPMPTPPLTFFKNLSRSFQLRSVGVT